MIKMKDLLGYFEQEAARRAHQAHRVQPLATLLPMRDGMLSEVDCVRAIYGSIDVTIFGSDVGLKTPACPIPPIAPGSYRLG